MGARRNPALRINQRGFNVAAPTTGLPNPGIVSSQNDANHSFLIQPYTGNNVRLFDTSMTTGTLTLTTPIALTNLSFLTSSGNGSGSLVLTLNFSDGFPSVLVPGTVSSPDWFFNNVPPVAITASGRVTPSTGVFDSVGTGNPRLYQSDIAVPAAASMHPISSISATWSGDALAHTAVFAVSGVPTLNLTAIPEPSTALVAVGLVLLPFLQRHRRRA